MGFFSKVFGGLLVLAIFVLAAMEAYRIRLYAIEVYGRIIHEFDPWFNYRATEYLARNGLAKFFKWFDYQSWYPLGRPVGTTIYPGMQMTSVALWKALASKGLRKALRALPFVPAKFNPKMSLNDVCVFVPAWFGSAATIITGLLTREVSGSWGAGAAASAIMAVIPAHLMRSVGGAYDNESVAMTAMVLTFWLWVRSLRSPGSWWIGAFAGVAYAYMVASWGGFIFVGNMVALHAAVLVGLGRFSTHLWASYSLWYVIGTAGAIQVPVVGLSPFKSMEQIGLLAVFLGVQFLGVTNALIARKGIKYEDNKLAFLRQRVQYALYVGAAAAVPLAALAATGFFGPLSVRVRSLFIKHTKTGNPLVDSVAEHQPAHAEAYKHYLNVCYYLAPVGLAILMLRGATGAKAGKAGSAAAPSAYSGVAVSKWFAILFALVAYYFSSRMARLIIFLGPIASVLSGVALDAAARWALRQVLDAPAALKEFSATALENAAAKAPTATTAAPAAATPSKAAAGADAKAPATSAKKADKPAPAPTAAASAGAATPTEEDLELLGRYGCKPLAGTYAGLRAMYNQPGARILRVLAAVALAWSSRGVATKFWEFSDNHSRQISQPSLLFKARLNDGREVMVRDYVEAYEWLKGHTPEDARILSWWDYGYQISGIGNRTTLADGNTWNLEHIALLGRILTSPEKKSHELARHLADYVLVWAGNHGDDLAKSPHMARIGSSVFPDICPKDPLCRHFGFSQQGVPSPSMAASTLYRMHSHNKAKGVHIDPKLWEEAYTSKYGLVRIYKVLNIDEESKAWAAEPANRKCDAPGSWYCVGAYPPKLPLKPPTSHRTLDYSDPTKYVEEKEL